MKKSPKGRQLEGVLRSSKLAAGGFMGADSRSLEEILDADAAAVEALGFTMAQIAGRMRELSDEGKKGLGTPVKVGDNLKVLVEESRGEIVCPLPHPGKFRKSFTVARRTDTGESVTWSDLSIHMIKEHGFFEGYGSAFRLDPEKLVEIIF